jgi:hypothetical protein
MPTSRWQASFSAGVLGPGLHGRMDLDKYDLGLKMGRNVFIHTHGGASNRAGTEFIAEVMDSSKTHRLIPFERSDTENFILLMGDSEMKVIEDGAFVQDGGSDYNPATPFASADLMALDFVQSVDVMFFAHPSYAPRKMTRASAVSHTFANVNVDPAFNPPTSLAVTPGSAGSESYTYTVAPVVDGIEGFPITGVTNASCEDLALDGAQNTISWTAGAGVDSYNVYRKRGGAFGYIGYTDDTSFVDDNIAPDLTFSPKEATGYFSGAGNYPGAVMLFQQRLCFANSNANPETIWFSQIGDYENFSRSRILRDSDGFEMDITGGSVNRIKFMLPLRELLVFASTGEWSIIGPNGGLPSTNPGQRQFGYSGVGSVKPIVAEDTALFVDRTGRSVRDLRYAFEQDGYAGNDLTIFAYHFFEGKEIVAWALQKNPYSLVWVALNDGTLLSFTYKREHQVWAWAEHDVGGDVESLAVIREGDEDALYMIVKRTIDGGTKRYVERLHTRQFDDVADAFFVDSGITYTGAATTTITGLDHLEGETVVALADGNVFENLTVASGQVTLPRAASTVHVGLYHYSEIETLQPPIQLQDVGSGRGRPIKASKVWVQIENTRGIKAGPSGGTLNEYIQTGGGDLSADILTETGTIEVLLQAQWNRTGSVRIRQDYPLPMTILGLAPDYSIGRTAE